MLFVTNLILNIFLNRPSNGALLFVLYTFERFLCPGFIVAWYDVVICEANMNRINPKPRTAPFARATTSVPESATPFHTNPVSTGRLIVLIPSGTNYSALTQRIWQLATATGKPILFLSLCREAAEEPSLRRQLITTSALVADSRVSTEAKVELGTNWVDVVKINYHAGDVIVCFAEQRTGLFHRPLSQILQSNLKAPIYILSGLSTQNLTQSNGPSQILAWSGSAGIIIGSFLLQIQITSYLQGWVQTVLILLSVIAEVWLVWVWNGLID